MMERLLKESKNFLPFVTSSVFTTTHTVVNGFLGHQTTYCSLSCFYLFQYNLLFVVDELFCMLLNDKCATAEMGLSFTFMVLLSGVDINLEQTSF